MSMIESKYDEVFGISCPECRDINLIEFRSDTYIFNKKKTSKPYHSKCYKGKVSVDNDISEYQDGNNKDMSSSIYFFCRDCRTISRLNVGYDEDGIFLRLIKTDEKMAEAFKKRKVKNVG